jgi:hypothetical protein
MLRKQLEPNVVDGIFRLKRLWLAGIKIPHHKLLHSVKHAFACGLRLQRLLEYPSKNVRKALYYRLPNATCLFGVMWRPPNSEDH